MHTEALYLIVILAEPKNATFDDWRTTENMAECTVDEELFGFMKVITKQFWTSS